MEGILMEPLVLNATNAVAGLLMTLAVAMAGTLFGYVADEEANRRRLVWAEEPLAEVGTPTSAEEPTVLRRAA